MHHARVSLLLASMLLACKGSASVDEAPKTVTKSEVVRLKVPPKPEQAPTPPSERPTLAAALEAKAAASAAKRPPEQAAIMQADLDRLAASDILARAIKAGDQAPDFTLANAAGEPVNLKALLERGPVVLLWYRGKWCPYCNITLKAYAEIAKPIAAAGATLVAISPERPDDSLDAQQKQELAYPVLSDLGNAVAKQYGIVHELTPELAAMYRDKFGLHERNGDDSNTLPLAATYVIGQDGVVRWAFLDVDYKKRAEPAEVLAQVRKLATERRPAIPEPAPAPG